MRRLIAALAFVLVASVVRADAPPADVDARVMRSLVKVIAICGNSARVGSGFVWGEKRQVVTDLHVVVGCPMPVNVLYFVPGGGQTERSATVARVLQAADLVLLTVNNPPEAPPLQAAAKPAAPEDLVEAFGFPLGVEAPINTPLQVTFANDLFPQLSSTLDDSAREELIKLHFPDLNSEVLHLNGPLQPGDSGAPVVNAAGDVVGIGSGGLQKGAASISWAMRARYLQRLAISTDPMPAAGDAGSLFAVVTRTVAAAHSKPLPGVQCGAMTLTYRGTRTLAQLRKTSGAAIPWDKLADLGADKALADASFDIWMEPKSGAAAIVPKGAALRPGNDSCRTEAGPHVWLVIQLGKLPDEPATPEWTLAEQQRGWQALHVYGNYINGMITGDNLTAWRPEVVANGALVAREVDNSFKGEGRLYRVELAGRRVFLEEAAVINVAEDQAAADTKLALARALTGVALATFSPLDQTQAGAVVPDDGAGGPGQPLYPQIWCGWYFELMSSAPRFGELAAKNKDAAALASVVERMADVSADRVAQAQDHVWAQTKVGIAALVPRGMQVVPGKGEDGACLFTSLSDPNLAAAVISRNIDQMTKVPEMLAAIWHAMGATVGKLQSMPSVVPNLELWQGTGMRNRLPVHVIVSVQTQPMWMVVFAIASADKPSLNPEMGAALGGALLAPSVTENLNR